MRVLHINSYYSSSKFYKNLYDLQIERGIDIDVFIPVASGFESMGFDFGNYAYLSENHKPYDKLIFYLKHKKILKSVKKNYCVSKYALIHAHSLFSNGYIAMKLNKQYGIPYVVAVRNTDVNIFFRKMIFLRKLGIEILDNAKYIIFISDSYRKLVLDKYVPESKRSTLSVKSRVIPNGIDRFWFDNLGKPKQKPETNIIRVLQVGDINLNKNIKLTIKALHILQSKGYEVELNVVGKIKDKKLFNQILKMDFVNYLGVMPKELLLDVYRSNDIFALPSKHETFGLVYAEAMSQGLPVLYTRHQGFDNQFSEGEVGYSIDSDSEMELVTNIEKVLCNYDALSNKCIEKVNIFNWDIIERTYQEYYEKIYEK